MFYYSTYNSIPATLSFNFKETITEFWVYVNAWQTLYICFSFSSLYTKSLGETRGGKTKQRVERRKENETWDKNNAV